MAIDTMRFLGIGEYNGLGDMYWRLSQAGHEVRVFVEKAEAHGIFAGMLERADDWRAELPWIRQAGADGVIVFESASNGALQDQLRREGFQVIGGSAWGDRLETDRAFGQEVLRNAGLRTAASWNFRSFAQALDFVAQRPGRYVYKLNGSTAQSTQTYIGNLDDGSDLRAWLELERMRWDAAELPDFLLMEHLQGVEVGIGAYFNGRDFLQPACLDWEHKRFFPGDLGELTGEMGTVVTYRGSERLFAETLGRVAVQLREGGYCGYINLNTIVNEQGVWPLEFTCRFGYPGFAICDALHAERWDSIFRKMLGGRELEISTREGFAVGVVLTVPPFPYEYGYQQLSKGAPVFFAGSMSVEERDRIHLAEIGLENGRLVTSGSLGYVLVATGCGGSVPTAQGEAYRLLQKVVVPNMRYRNDIGDKFIRSDQAMLRSLGYID
jgi:phosphoribosylamine--glycine ligase